MDFYCITMPTVGFEASFKKEGSNEEEMCSEQPHGIAARVIG